MFGYMEGETKEARMDAFEELPNEILTADKASSCLFIVLPGRRAS